MDFKIGDLVVPADTFGNIVGKNMLCDQGYVLGEIIDVDLNLSNIRTHILYGTKYWLPGKYAYLMSGFFKKLTIDEFI